ncbi:hypothetical protein B9G98_04567 [Wickerhamiella sorbophila]|uniref:Extracellular membrane protein CFEM domain-containing protein n=1 Tax=Wickerhamiella sorbophila TaxID=45607 RepID=A0A2T0FPQ9_9ASCO|nr:hypothetical protein B9G98_04567 [Wickerhamiella sorbophila]PRT56947.1 hypothetical protein B9G98_04567 [Wickerhamiella sorbophila]
MVVARTVISLHLASLALGLAIPPSLPNALTNITANCQKDGSRNACSVFITDALNTCHPSDMACVCSQFASIVDYCGTTCNYDPGSLDTSKEFMNQECAKVEWKKPPLQAAGVLDRVLGHARKHNDDETDSEYDDEDHSTCNNGDDSDPGTNWQAYGKRSLIEDSAHEIALADGSDVNVGDSISLRDRLLIHGVQGSDGAHLVIKPDHYENGILRRDSSETETENNEEEQATSAEQCDYDDARKQIAQEIVHAADSAFANAPKKTIENFLENVLTGISRTRNSRKRPQRVADHSEPIDNEEELSEPSNSHEEHDTSYQNDEEDVKNGGGSTVVSLVYVTESAMPSHHELQTPSIPLLTLPATTVASLGISDVEEPAFETSSITTKAITSSAATASVTTTATTATASTTTTATTTATTSPSIVSDSSDSLVSTNSAVPQEPSSVTTEFAQISSPAVEPPSLTIARAFSLADELALEEEMDGQSAEEQPELEVDGENELQLASSFASKYLEMSSAKFTSSFASATSGLASITSGLASVNSSVPEAKVSAWGTPGNHYVGDHMRAGDGTDSLSNNTSNSTANSTYFSATSQKGAKSGAVLNSVSALAITIGLFLATTF